MKPLELQPEAREYHLFTWHSKSGVEIAAWVPLFCRFAPKSLTLSPQNRQPLSPTIANTFANNRQHFPLLPDFSTISPRFSSFSTHSAAFGW
jgi:hypothetical protein